MANTQFLSVGDAALRVGRSPETVRVWIRTGRLRSQRTVGGMHLLEADDVDAAAKGARNDVPPATAA